VDLNGITLQSSILDYGQAGTPVNLLPTLCADAWFHQRTTVDPRPPGLPAFMDTVVPFARGDYAAALAAFPDADPGTVTRLSEYTGISPTVLTSWEGLNVADTDRRGTLHFLTTLEKAQGKVLGAYDGRVLAVDTGIAADLDPLSGGNDATMTAVNGAYTAAWNSYLADDLRYTSTSAFTDLNDQAFQNWDFRHTDPADAQRGLDVDGAIVLYTAGDLAAAMALNPDLLVLSANGYYDSVTPFAQTEHDLAAMPLTDPEIRKNLTVRYYPSGHMIYLDGGSRTALKAGLAALYDAAVGDREAVHRIRARQRARRADV
jgi:carboxypeptidase C (cathepsin A)